jgi:DNA repair photolyase
MDEPEIPARIGRATVSVLDRAQILARPTGFMTGYDYTLNPYVGCQFGCAYCYAAFFIPSAERRESWGDWVDVKRHAVAALKRRRRLAGKRIYVGSVTDPYQPLEARISLTRSILEYLAEEDHQPRLVLQTRAPLVTRDIDLFRRYRHLRVNITVTTDSEDVRKRFEPLCPSNDRRLAALEEVKRAGVRTSACVTPMLPLEDPERFARRLAALEADIYVAQPFKPSGGTFAAATRRMALEIAQEYNWTDADYRRAFDLLRRFLPNLYEGREGFMPE